MVHWRGDLFSVAGWSALMALLVVDGWWLALVPAAIVVAYIGAFTGTWTKRLLSIPLITTIGGMCYTIYLYHFSIIIVFSRLTFNAIFGRSLVLNLLVQMVLVGAITLALSFVLFALFERPFMDKQWPQKLLARLRPVSTPSSTSV